MRKGMLLGLVACACAALPALAGAQFFYRLNINSIGLTTCNTTTQQTLINGDADWILPPSTDNLRIVRFVNGALVSVEFLSVTPFSFDNQPVASVLNFLPVATALPYTAAVEALPYSNGAAVGTGFRTTWICDSAGGGTFSLAEVVAFTSVSVPATSSPALATLVMLLALAAWATLRRRTRR